MAGDQGKVQPLMHCNRVKHNLALGDWTPDHDHALIRVVESTARY